MAIVKLKKPQRYVVSDCASIELIKCPVALAVWVYLMSKPENWTVRYTDIQNRFDIGRDRVSKAIKHLRECGLVEFSTIRESDGRLAGTEITVYSSSDRGTENQGVGSTTEALKTRDSVKPRAGKSPPLINKELLTNKDLLTNTEPTARFCFKSQLSACGVREPHLSDFMKARKLKKAANTETAYKLLANEAVKAGISLDRAVFIAASEGWKGFKAEWLRNAKNGQFNNDKNIGFIERHTDKSWAAGIT